MTDYPDWIRVNQAVGSPLYFNRDVQIADAQLLGPWFVGNWDAVEFAIAVIAPSFPHLFTVTAKFYVDAAMTQVVSQYDWQCQSGTQVLDVIATQGLYMSVQIGHGAAPQHMSVIIVPRLNYTPAALLSGFRPLDRAAGVAIGGGVTATRKVPIVCATRATLCVFCTAVNWEAWLMDQDITGASLGIIASMGSTAGKTPGVATIDVPPDTMIFSITNHDAGAQQYSFALVPTKD